MFEKKKTKEIKLEYYVNSLIYTTKQRKKNTKSENKNKVKYEKRLSRLKIIKHFAKLTKTQRFKK